MKQGGTRYYFPGYEARGYQRLLSAGLLVFGVIMAVLSRSLIGSALFGLAALAGLYGLVRRRRLEFYAEAGEDGLVLKAVVVRRLFKYADLQSVDYWENQRGALVQTLLDASAALSRLFLREYSMARPGEIDRRTLILRFRRTRWLAVPLPPFLWPRRSWMLPPLGEQDAASLRSEALQRLQPHA